MSIMVAILNNKTKFYNISVCIIFKQINLVAFEFTCKSESVIDILLVHFYSDNILLDFIYLFSSKIKLEIMYNILTSLDCSKMLVLRFLVSL